MIFDLLHDNFKVIIANMIKYKDKIIKEIEQILALTEIKLVSKQIIGMIENSAMTSKKLRKKKVFSIKKYFNSGKLNYFKKDYNQLNIHLLINKLDNNNSKKP